MLIKKLQGFLCALLMGFTAATPSVHAAPATDAQAIEYALKKLFDKPSAPLTVVPVSVEGDYAVAGWTQDQRGGRALLQRDKGGWRIALCGGDGLVKADALAQSGLTPAAAKRLAQAIQSAEAGLSPHQRRLLSTFDGILKVDAGHGASHPAGLAAHH